jgi:hypothetical protein
VSDTPESVARALLADLGFEEYRTNGDLVVLANLIHHARMLASLCLLHPDVPAVVRLKARILQSTLACFASTD